MARLTDADTLKESMIGACNILEKHGIDTMIARAVISIIDGIAGVDAEPVRHGRWINYPECLGYEGAYHDEHIVCSACHSVWNIIDNDADRFDYCPNCGAKMDGGDNDANVEEHA